MINEYGSAITESSFCLKRRRVLKKWLALRDVDQEWHLLSFLSLKLVLWLSYEPQSLAFGCYVGLKFGA